MRLLAPLPTSIEDVIRKFTGLYTGEHGDSDSGLIRMPARSFTKPQNIKQGRFGDYAGMRVTELIRVQ